MGARCCQSGPCARSTGRFCAQPLRKRLARRRRCADPLNVGEFCTEQTCEHSPPPMSRTIFQLFVRKSTVTVSIAQPLVDRTFLGGHLWRILRCFRYSLSQKNDEKRLIGLLSLQRRLQSRVEQESRSGRVGLRPPRWVSNVAAAAGINAHVNNTVWLQTF